MKNKIKKSLFLLTSAVLFFSCTDASKNAEQNPPVFLSSSDAKLAEKVSALRNPKGLISCTLQNIVGQPGSVLTLKKDQGGSLCEDRENFHEYFIFDEDESIFILQTNPTVFLYINSKEFHFHLTNEYNQFVANPTIGATDKIKNSQTFYRTVGDYEIALSFTPNEAVYSSSGANEGRIQDRNSASYIDFWRLLDASRNAVVYIPGTFEEQRLFTDLYCQVQKGNTRRVYTPESLMTLNSLPEWFRTSGDERYDKACVDAQQRSRSTIRPWYMLRSDLGSSLKFFISFGKDLVINDALLGAEDINFADRLKLTRPYAFFVTVPLGNSMEEAAQKDYLNNRHGFTLQIRGNVDSLYQNARDLGMPGYEDAFAPVKVLSASVNGSTLKLNWSEVADVQIRHYATAAKKTLAEIEAIPDGSFSVMANATGTNEKTFNIGTGLCANGSITRGCAHWFRVSGVSTTPSNAVAVVPRDPAENEILFTEIMWMGTAQSGDTDSYDEWFEIKNTSTQILELSTLDFYNGGNTRDKITFGPNYNASATLTGHEPLGSRELDPEGFLYPGEYAVVARKTDVYFANFTGLKLYKRTTGNFSNSGTSLYLGLGLSGESIGTTLNTVTYDGTKGENGTPKKSMVYTTTPEWGTSAIDSNQPAAGLNFATPGFAGAGEY